MSSCSDACIQNFVSFYSSRRRCLGTPRMFLFPSPSSPSSSPSVRSARSLQKGHLVIFFPYLRVCACLLGIAVFSFATVVIVFIPFLCVWAENIVRNPTETYETAFLYDYCLFNKILLGISTIFNQIGHI